MCCLAAASSVIGATPRTVFARDGWATLDRGVACEAVARAEQVSKNPAERARVAIVFDRGGPRRGQLAVQLGRSISTGSAVMLTVEEQPFLLTAQGRFAWSRGPAQEAAIIATMRSAHGLRIEARSPLSGRFSDHYLLAGAPGAIDAAAACAARPLEKARDHR